MSSSIHFDEQAFERLLADNGGRLRRLAGIYARRDDASDLLQEIYLQLWRSRHRFDGRAKASTWLFRVALNTAMSFARKQNTEKRRRVLTDENPEPTSPGDHEAEMALLEQFLQSLDAVKRATLLMHLEGLDNEAIAEVLDCSPASVATRLTRLRQQFEKSYLPGGES